MELQHKQRELGFRVIAGLYCLEPPLEQQNYVSFFNESLDNIEDSELPEFTEAIEDVLF